MTRISRLQLFAFLLGGIVPLATTMTSPTVAIVGGGFAGLAAARRLHDDDIEFVLFEAEDRLGGRVKPQAYKDGFIQHGAEYINGKDHAMYNLAKKLGVIEQNVGDYEYMRTEKSFGACEVDKGDVDAFEAFVEPLEDKYSKLAEKTEHTEVTIAQLFKKDYENFLKQGDRKSKKQFFDSLARHYLSYYPSESTLKKKFYSPAEWSAPADQLALQNYYQWDDGTNDGGSYTLGKKGFQAILENLKTGLPAGKVRLNSRVINIDYSGSKTRLTLSSGPVKETFDFVIVTVPLGHLKKFSDSLFTPALPKKKQQAIKDIGFGHNGKVFLEYEKPFWQPETKAIVPVRIDGCQKPSALLNAFSFFHPVSWTNNTLTAWVQGSGTQLVDQLDDATLAKTVTEYLREMLQDKSIPEPKKVLRSKWASNDLYLGSYSFLTPEAVNDSDDAYADLATPIKKDKVLRILFAGEATHSNLFQTTTGAFLSGQREADRIKKFLEEQDDE